MSTSKAGKRRRVAARKDLHEQLALAALVAIALHGVLLLSDRWLRPGLVGILVPFAAPYRPLWTGLGVLAAYFAALFGLSYYARRLVGARRWRKLHRFTPIVYVLSAIHMLGAGTDSGTMWLRLLVVGTAVPIAALLALRLAESHRRSAPAARSAREPAARVVHEDRLDVLVGEHALLAERR